MTRALLAAPERLRHARRMTLPRTGARRVEHDGRRYLWRIRKLPTYAQLIGGSPLTVAIQLDAPGPRSVLVVECTARRSDAIPPSQTGITPSMVRAMIATAIEEGWEPASRASHRLRFPVIAETIGVLLRADRR